MISNIINMLWVRGSLPWYAEVSIRSFIEKGHQVHLYSYERAENVPQGCHILNAQEILSETQVFTYRDGRFTGHLSGFSDWFRYELLSQKGGWWVDTDVICLKRFEFREDYVFASGWEPTVPKFVNSNVIFVKEPLCKIMKVCAEASRQKGSFAQHGEMGPVLLNKVVRENRLESYIQPPWVFNPIHYGDLRLLMRSCTFIRLVAMTRSVRGLRPIFLNRATSAVHLYSAILDRDVPLKSLTDIPPSSYLRSILIKAQAIN